MALIRRLFINLGLSVFALVAAEHVFAKAQEQTKSSVHQKNLYPHAMEAIGSVREIYDGKLSPTMAVNTFRNIDRLFPSHRIFKSTKPKALPVAKKTISEFHFTDRGRKISLEQYLELNQVAGLLILKDGQIHLEKYRYGNSSHTRWMSMSIAKSITSTLIGAAIKQGKIRHLDDPVIKYVPELKDSAYQQVTVRDVLMMSSGVRWNEAYSDPRSDRRKLLDAQIAQLPGSAMRVMASLPQASAPGSRFNYSTGETQVAAQLLRNAIGMPLSTYLQERIWSKYGMEADATWWLDAPNGVEIGGSGFSATLRDYGRFGMFMLGGGLAAKELILPTAWTYEAGTPKRLRQGDLIPYGYLWWPVVSEQGFQDGAYTAVGIHGQYLYLNPRSNIVIVVWGAQVKPTGSAVVDDQAFFAAVSAQLAEKNRPTDQRKN
jgi:CubicO group peptidase (beta-lactamase class C family)